MCYKAVVGAGIRFHSLQKKAFYRRPQNAANLPFFDRESIIDANRGKDPRFFSVESRYGLDFKGRPFREIACFRQPDRQRFCIVAGDAFFVSFRL